MVLTPPDRQTIVPRFATIRAGTTFWRIQHDRYPDIFNPRPHIEPFGGGRFDANQLNRYPFCYLAFDPRTALCERLLRSLPFPAGGADRVLPFAAVDGRSLRAVRTIAELRLLGLRDTQELARVHADEWLVQAEPHDYPYTRGWAHWLRPRAPEADGFVWPSRRNLSSFVLVLFGDRCEKALEWDPREPAVDLDSSAGIARLNRELAPYRVTVGPRNRSRAGFAGSAS